MKLSRVAAVAAVATAVSCLLATSAQAFPKIYLHPIDLVAYQGDAVRVSVEIPCGGALYGIVAEPTGRTLTLAAAVAYDAVVCTSLGQRTEVVLDYLAVKSYGAIAPMKVEGGARLAVAPINDLKLMRSDGEAARLTAVYEPRCGATVGTLIRAPGGARLELAMVEKTGGTPASACSARPRKVEIAALDAKARMKVAPLRDKPKSLSRVYRLALAPVEDGSIRSSPTGGLSFRYQRPCNAAPVGVVLSEPRIEAGRTIVAIGMLVAQYDNYPCAGGLARGAPLTSVFSDSQLALPAGAAVRLVMPRPGQGDTGRLKLTAATDLTYVDGAAGVQTLRVKYLKNCNERSYVVWARDGGGRLAVGVVTRGADDGGRPCISGATEVSLKQPYVAGRATSGRVASLRIKGMAAH